MAKGNRAERRRGRRKTIRFVRHWVEGSGSDHLTLFVHVQIRKGRRPWVDVLLVSINMGGRFSKADLAQVLARTSEQFQGKVVVALQEGSDKDWVEEVARKHGFSHPPTDGAPGQSATPTLVGPGIKVTWAKWVLLLDKIVVGKGAGPDRNKPKWWKRNRLVAEGVVFEASSWHEIASQQHAKRLKAAKRMASWVVRTMRLSTRPVFAIGDTNSDDDQALSQWLRARGLTSNHRELKEIATMERRSIDAVYCAKRLVLAA